MKKYKRKVVNVGLTGSFATSRIEEEMEKHRDYRLAGIIVRENYLAIFILEKEV